MFTIGGYAIHSRALLAPMAGVTDMPFRQLCARYGAGLTTTEMLTSDTRLWQSKKSQSRLRFAEDKAGKKSHNLPVSVQIAGSDAQMLAQAAKAAAHMGANIIDINMGCPAKKVCKKAAGSALLKDEKLVSEILQRVVESVADMNIPVTLKTRTGWDSEHKNALRVGRIAEDAGIQAITLHGRTRACRFNGQAEYDTIAALAQSVAIPVIANGDICSGKQAYQVLDYTGATAVMLGRAALGKPWLFREVNQFLHNQKSGVQPEPQEIKSVMTEHLLALHAFYGEYQGVRFARKHVGWYCQHLTGGRELKNSFNKLDKPGSQLRAIVSHFEQYDNINEEKAA